MCAYPASQIVGRLHSADYIRWQLTESMYTCAQVVPGWEAMAARAGSRAAFPLLNLPAPQQIVHATWPKEPHKAARSQVGSSARITDAILDVLQYYCPAVRPLQTLPNPKLDLVKVSVLSSHS